MNAQKLHPQQRQLQSCPPSTASGRLWTRSIAIATAAVAMVALMPGLLHPAAAARSSKPKEIVVVGRKIKEVIKETDAERERPVEVIFEVAADRSLDEEERSAVKAEVPDLLNDLCAEGDDDAGRCDVEDMENALVGQVVVLLRSFDDFDLDSLSVRIAARRDASTPPVMLGSVLLALGLLETRRRRQTTALTWS